MDRVLCIMPIYKYPNKYFEQAISSLYFQYGVDVQVSIVFHGEQIDQPSLLADFHEKVKITEYPEDHQEFSAVNMINFGLSKANLDNFDYVMVISDDMILTLDAFFLMIDQMKKTESKIAIPNFAERIFRIDKYVATNLSILDKPIETINLDVIKEVNYSVIIPFLISSDLMRNRFFDSTFSSLFMINFLNVLVKDNDIVNTDAYVFEMSDENLYGFSFGIDRWASAYQADYKRLKG